MTRHSIKTRPFGTTEGLDLEFKRAEKSLPRNFFETVCAFLNLDGGSIILGVEDDGGVSGVDPEAVEQIKTDIANLSNNPQKLDPPYLLFPQAEQVDGKWVIKTLVPSSSQVHQVDGHAFLRSEDGDYRLKGIHQLAGLMNRKLSFFTEQRVLPFLELSDLDAGLFEKAERLMRSRQPEHPWAGLEPAELLRVAGFVRKDFVSGEPGFTLAAAMMFGTDETIQSAAPGYKFDFLLRRRDTERYDDRLTVRTNLIDAFELLMGFVEKHLNDPFHLEGTTRVSLRSFIFRELVATIIAHREYTSAAPATMAIYEDRVEFKNPNVPHYHGRIDPAHFTPFPKNPTICRFLIQLGRYEELGSGVRRVTQYLPFYAPGAGKAVFDDGMMFTVTVPLKGEEVAADTSTAQVTHQVTPQVTPQVTHQVAMVLEAAETPRSAAQLLASAGLRDRAHFRKAYLEPLLQVGWIERTIPEKPTSRLQKYRLTEAGRKALEESKKE